MATSRSIPARVTRTLYSKGAFDNRDLKMRSAPGLEQQMEKFRAFIDAWEAAPDLAAVAKKLGISKSNARSRACYLRAKLAGHGVQLKKFPKTSAPDYQVLAEYLATIRRKP